MPPRLTWEWPERAGIPGFPPVPVPAGGALDETMEFFDEESVTFEYPSDSLPDLVSYYPAWFATQGVDPDRLSVQAPRDSGT